MKIRLVVGLGNPGSRYENTRHNIGFLLVDSLAERHGWTFKEEKQFFGLLAKGTLGEDNVWLLKPTTYMNESGRAVRKVMDFFKLEPEEVLVVTDDVVIDYSQFRLRDKGSSGGHNGLKSVQSHLGSVNYPRLRMGVGDRKHGELSSHVLGRFSADEAVELPSFIEKGRNYVERLLDGEDFRRVMNEANTRLKNPESNKNSDQEKKKAERQSTNSGVGEQT